MNPILILTQRLLTPTLTLARATLALTADERCRSRHQFMTTGGEMVTLQLPRGTVLQDGDRLQSQDGQHWVQVVAKPEPIMVAIAPDPLTLLRAAYHLGNRHVPLEITTTDLRLAPDPVLKTLLEQLGVAVTESIAPFQPEAGAYSHGHYP